MNNSTVIDKQYIEFCKNITEEDINEVVAALNKYMVNVDGEILIKDEYKMENFEKNWKYYYRDDFRDAIYDFVEYKSPTCVTWKAAEKIREEEDPMELICRALFKRYLNRKRYAKSCERRKKEKDEIKKYPAFKYIFIRDSGIMVSRDVDNFNANTFDFVSVEIFKGTYTAEFIEQHKDEIIEAALYKISISKKFTKYNVPIGVLKLDGIRLIGNDMVLYFSVKQL